MVDFYLWLECRVGHHGLVFGELFTYVLQTNSYYTVSFYLREELTEKYKSKLSSEMNGPIHEVMSRLVKAVTGRKITIPGVFKRYLFSLRLDFRCMKFFIPYPTFPHSSLVSSSTIPSVSTFWYRLHELSFDVETFIIIITLLLPLKIRSIA